MFVILQRAMVVGLSGNGFCEEKPLLWICVFIKVVTNLRTIHHQQTLSESIYNDKSDHFNVKLPDKIMTSIQTSATSSLIHLFMLSV